MDLELPLVGLCWDDQRHLILIWPPGLRPITGCWACTIWPHQRHNSSIWLRRYENPIGWTNPARTYYGFGCMLALSFCFVYSSKIIIKIIIIYVYVYWIFFANILVLYCKWQSNCRRLLVHGVLCFKMCAWRIAIAGFSPLSLPPFIRCNAYIGVYTPQNGQSIMDMMMSQWI